MYNMNTCRKFGVCGVDGTPLSNPKSIFIPDIHKDVLLPEVDYVEGGVESLASHLRPPFTIDPQSDPDKYFCYVLVLGLGTQLAHAAVIWVLEGSLSIVTVISAGVAQNKTAMVKSTIHCCRLKISDNSY